MTTPADRAKALLEKFGPLNHPNEVSADGIYSDYVDVGDLVVWADTYGDGTLGVLVYDFASRGQTPILRLSSVRDDDLVASIIQQVIDHHNGRQVV